MSEYANAAQVIYQSRAHSYAPKVIQSVSEWADANRMLSKKGSAEPGQWRTDRNPMLREIMDCFSATSDVKEVVFKSCIQSGKSEIAINVLGYFMCNIGGPIMVALPAEVSMGKWINQKLNPLIEETPAVSSTLTTTNTRNSANQKDFKDFYGGQLYLEHAGSPARLKSTSVKFLIVDELTEFAANLQTGDDPLMLLEDRTSAFPATFKRLYISSPGIKGLCRTDELYEKSDQRFYKMPCPHCQSSIVFEWAGLLWDEGGTNVRYVCPECACEIDEYHKTSMMLNGRWFPTYPDRKIRGYSSMCLYYQIGLGPRWTELVAQWLDIHNDLPRLKSFINSRLAVVWEDPAMRKVQMNVIQERAESYNLREIQQGCCVLTCGVDTQDNRLEAQIVGWGQGMASWTIDYKVFLGDPADTKVWDELTEWINKPIRHINGHWLNVQATAIDAGGHRTEAVKNFVRQKKINRPMVTFGAVANNAPVLSKAKAQDVNWRGVLNKKGVHIQHIGTVAVKNLLFGRLATDGDKELPERLVHFSDQLPDEFFQGITSETFDPRKNRFILKRRARNEQLDTWVYAFAATHHQELRLHLYTRAQWQILIDRYSEISIDNPVIAVQTISTTSGISLAGWGRR